MIFLKGLKQIVYYYLALKLVKSILKLSKQKKLKIATAESCTGGLIGSLFTAIPGSSEVFKAGIIAYDNEVKKSILNVSEKTLSSKGAVSKQTVLEMGSGLLSILHVEIALSISGIAGPGGGSKDKAVGTIWTNISIKENEISHYPFLITHNRGRNLNRIYSAYHLLKRLEDLLKKRIDKDSRN